jgi:hypothetical protein
LTRAGALASTIAILWTATAAEGQEPAPPPVEESLRAGADLAWWIVGMDFQARTATQAVEIEEPSLVGLEVWGELEVGKRWSVRAGLEYAEGIDMKALGGSVGVVHRPGLLDEPWDVSFGAGLVAGRLEMDDVPGVFDPGIGLEASARLEYRLTDLMEALSAHVALGLRYQRFNFDGDAGILDADDSEGGAGIRIVAGLDYRF